MKEQRAQRPPRVPKAYVCAGIDLRALREQVGAPLAWVATEGGWAGTGGVTSVERSGKVSASVAARYYRALNAWHVRAGEALAAFGAPHAA